MNLCLSHVKDNWECLVIDELGALRERIVLTGVIQCWSFLFRSSQPLERVHQVTERRKTNIYIYIYIKNRKTPKNKWISISFRKFEKIRWVSLYWGYDNHIQCKVKLKAYCSLQKYIRTAVQMLFILLWSRISFCVCHTHTHTNTHTHTHKHTHTHTHTHIYIYIYIYIYIWKKIMDCNPTVCKKKLIRR